MAFIVCDSSIDTMKMIRKVTHEMVNQLTI